MGPVLKLFRRNFSSLVALKVFALSLGVLGLTGMLESCGRTDLDLSGPAGQDAGTGSGGRDAAVAGSGGRVDARVDGSGGRAATGGVTTGGRSGSGGRAATGGSGGRMGSGGTVAAVDAGTRDVRGPDLPPSTPGTLTCGAQICDTKTQSCCVSIAVGSVGAHCVPTGSTCGGLGLDCDEPSDCAGGTCCFGLQTGAGGPSVGSRCTSQMACAGIGRFVVCRSNADCGGANPICCVLGGGVPLCQPACR